MFEIIKCYMRLRRMEKINRGFIRVGKVLKNDEIIKKRWRGITIIDHREEKDMV